MNKKFYLVTVLIECSAEMYNRRARPPCGNYEKAKERWQWRNRGSRREL